MSTPIIIAAGVAIFLGVVGGLMTPIGPWYRNLRKPSLQPPDWLFGPAWTIILGLAAWSAVIAWNAAPDAAARTSVVILFATNAVFHLAVEPAVLPRCAAPIGRWSRSCSCGRRWSRWSSGCGRSRTSRAC